MNSLLSQTCTRTISLSVRQNDSSDERNKAQIDNLQSHPIFSFASRRYHASVFEYGHICYRVGIFKWTVRKILSTTVFKYPTADASLI